MALSDEYLRGMRERIEYVHPPFQKRPAEADRERTGPCDSSVSLAVPGEWKAEVDAAAAMLGQSRSMVIRGAVDWGLEPYLKAGGRVDRPEKLHVEDLARERKDLRVGGDPDVKMPPPRSGK